MRNLWKYLLVIALILGLTASIGKFTTLSDWHESFVVFKVKLERLSGLNIRHKPIKFQVKNPGYLSLTPINLVLNNGNESAVVLTLESSNRISWFAVTIANIPGNGSIRVTPRLCELSSRSPSCLLIITGQNIGNASIVASAPGYSSVLSSIVVLPVSTQSESTNVVLNSQVAESNMAVSSPMESSTLVLAKPETKLANTNSALDGSTVRAVTIGNGHVYVGTDNGNVWVSMDGGGWQKVGDLSPENNASVSALAVEGNNIYAATNDYVAGMGKVWVEKINENTWSLVGGGAPESSSRINSIVVRGNNVYVATSDYVAGSGNVWVSSKQQAWRLVGNGLPKNNSIIWSIAATDDKVYAASSNYATHVGKVWVNSGTGNWRSVGTKLPSSDSTIRTMAVNEDGLYVATASGDIFVKSTNTNWHLFGGKSPDKDALVWSIATVGPSVYVGTSKGNVWLINNGLWHLVGGAAPEVNGQVLSIVANNDEVYAGMFSGNVWRYTTTTGWQKAGTPYQKPVINTSESITESSVVIVVHHVGADNHDVESATATDVNSATEVVTTSPVEARNDMASDYRVTNVGNMLVESGTAIWQMVKNNLPENNAHILSIEQSSGTLYVITKNNQNHRVGIWIYNQTGNKWRKVGGYADK